MEKNGVEVVKYDHKKWINQRQLENNKAFKYSPYYIIQNIKDKGMKYKIENYQPCKAFLDEELVIQIMMDTKTTAVVKFRDKLGINQHDLILTKEQPMDSKIRKVFQTKK